MKESPEEEDVENEVANASTDGRSHSDVQCLLPNWIRNSLSSIPISEFYMR